MDDTPQNHRAYGALDETGHAYVVLEPIKADPRLETKAIKLDAIHTLQHAELLADDFNEGRAWAFRVSSPPLTGDQIPTLLTPQA